MLWSLGWPVTAALYVASRGWLGRLAPPLTAVVLLSGGALWWGETLTAAPVDALLDSAVGWDTAGPPTGAVADPVGRSGEVTAHPGLDASTLDVEITECVQTRSVSSVQNRTARQPRVTLRLTNRGPARSVVVHGAVLLDAYAWNSGWKPTSTATAELATGQSTQVTLMPNYRHQASYTPDGLRGCAVPEVELRAPELWPGHPARRVVPLEVRRAADTERPFDPVRDYLRPDTR